MEWRCKLKVFGLVVWLAGCSTPYRPPVVVHDSDDFPGINQLLKEDSQRPLDVLLVHGMCTHDSKWAHQAIDKIAKKIDPHYAPKPGSSESAQPNEIQIVTQTSQLAGATVRLTALVWSPLTSNLKQQLAYDRTGTYNDCSKAGNTEENCKPRRSHYNGQFKDGLLNDCLADALIYEGRSHKAIRLEMANTLKRVLEDSSGNQAATLVFISESLGSKILYDALDYMLKQKGEKGDDRMRALAAGAMNQLALVFMGANQLPMLRLAEQNALAVKTVAPPSPPQQDSLASLLDLRRRQPGPKRIQRLAIVAITDPNDLLSYRLLRSQYASADVAIANVLVSNKTTWLGQIEEPYGAHTTYLDNPDVERLIMTGWERERGERSAR